MVPCEFKRAQSPEDARTLTAAAHSRVIAGGTSLLDLMKLGVERPARLVDINRLPLTRIERREDGLHIGALVRNSDLAQHAAVMAGFPGLGQAILSGASP